MNKQIRNSLLICIGLPIFFGLLFFAAEGSSHAEEAMIYIGLAFLIASVIYLPLGIILAAIKDSRPIGQGMLLASGAVLLIGFSICGMIK